VKGTQPTSDGNTGFEFTTAFGAGYQNWDPIFTGLNFWIKTSQACTIRVGLVSPLVTDYAHYGYSFKVLANTWTFVNIPKASFKRPTWGTMTNPPTLDQVLGQLTGLTYFLDGGAFTNLSVWLDNVCMQGTSTMPAAMRATTNVVTLSSGHGAGDDGTMTPTPVVTATPTSTPVGVTFTKPVAYPNPVKGSGTVNIGLPLDVPSDVTLQVYTVAQRKVQEVRYPHVMPNEGVTLDLLDKAGIHLANGLYYVVAITPEHRWTVKLLVLN
jgi:hypothetical protein